MQTHSSYKADISGAASGQIKVGTDPWGEFFGEPRFTGSMSAYDVERRDTWVLPEAWKGANKLISDRVEFEVYTDENFYTQIIMPISVVDGANYVTWNITEYAQQMPTLVPELGAMRMMSSSKRSGSASFDRRGQMFYFEHGFMHSPAGRAHYQNTLIQLRNNILEFAKFDVIYTLLTSQNYNFEWERKNGVYKERQVADVLKNELWMWACLQRLTNAMVLLDTKIGGWMQRYKGRADSWLLPPAIAAYLQVVPAESTEYFRAGPAGPRRLEDGVNAYTRIGQSQVFITRTYDIDVGGPRDILAAPYEIGEYVQMRDRSRLGSYDAYTSKERSVEIYNEDNNSWFECTLRWALDNCQRFNEKTGALRAMPTDFDTSSLDVYGKSGRDDVFLYYDADSQQHLETKFFGQMERDYLSVQDRLALAQTVVASFGKSLRNYDEWRLQWADGIDLVSRIDALGLNTDDVAALQSVSAPPAGAEAGGIQAEMGQSGGERLQSKPDPNLGGVPFPEAGAFKDGKVHLLPGYQSYPGLKAMAARQGDPAYKDIESDLVAAKNFVKASDQLYEKMRIYFPDSIGLDQRFASPWWQQPSGQTVFFENFVSRHRVPLFVSQAEGGAAVADTADAKQTYARVLAEQKIQHANRAARGFDSRAAGADVRGPAAEQVAIAGDEGATAAQTARAILIYAIMARVATVKDDPVKNGELYQAVKLALYGATSGFDITKRVNGAGSEGAAEREALLKVALAVPNAFGRQPQRVREAINDIFEAQLGAPDAKSQNSLPFNKGMVRTTLLASPAVVESIANDPTLGQRVLPASPNNPDSAMTWPQVRSYSNRFSADRAFATSTSRFEDTAPASGQFPAFEGIASDLSTSLEHTAIMQNARSNSNNARASSFVGDQMDVDAMSSSSSSSSRIGAGWEDEEVAPRARQPSARQGLEGRHRVRPNRTYDDAIQELGTQHMRDEWREVQRAAANDRLLGAIAHAFDATPVTKLALERFIDHNILFPLSFLVARPHMTYNMLSAIHCLAGSTMGAYLTQAGRFELGDDVDIQAHTGTFTYKSKAVVYRPEHVFVARNVFAAGYLGGDGSKVFDPTTYAAGSGEYRQQSIFVLAVPYSLSTNGDVIDLSGDVRMLEQRYQLRTRGQLDYVGVRFYNALFGWRSAQQNEEGQGYGALDQVSDRINCNTRVFQGTARLFDRQSQKFMLIQRGNGHWGADCTYLGCDAVRRGDMLQFDRERGRHPNMIEV